MIRRAAPAALAALVTFAPCAALALACAAAPAAAAPRAYLAASAGWGRYQFADVNRDIEVINQAVAPFHLRQIHGGTTVSAEAGVKLSTGTAVGVAFDHLAAGSFIGDPSLYLHDDLPANVYRLTAAQSFPLRGRLAARLVASVGLLSARGQFRVVVGSESQQFERRGTSVMGEGLAGLELAAGRHADLTLDLGYRRARAGKLTDAGQPVLNSDGSRFAVDYSGFVTRAGVRILLMR